MRPYSRLNVTLLLILSLALASLLGMKPVPVHAATIVVNTVVDENDGSCTDADCSLRDAIATAAPGDTIVFAPALSGQTITLSLGTLQVWTSLTIDGSGLAQHVKISGNNAVRVFLTLSGDGVTLRELDIVNGYVADGSGGSGIYNQHTLTVTGCTVSGNTTPDNGGGIRNTGAATVENSVVSNNQAGYGGGIRNEGDLTVRNSTVSDNTADFGGGIDNYVGSLAMTNTTVERNTAVHYGGGITTSADAIIEDSIFRGNAAESGGGIESHEAGVTLTLTRCTFTGNTAHLPAGFGAALYNDLTTVEVNDSTFGGNSADNAGGGVYNGPSGALTINDSAFTGNTAASATAGYGGAVENNGTLALNRSTFTDNTALFNGGAIENWDGALTVTGCTFTGNIAAVGGAINNNTSGTLTLRNSTLDSNAADNVGGGIYNDNNSTVTLENSTLSANTASYEGGGIYNVSGAVTLSHATFAGNSTGIHNAATLNYRNTIVAGSGGDDCINDGAIGENVNNLVEDGTCSPLLTGDPRLGPLANNGGPTETHALLPDSPAIDAGDAATCLAADQRGATRPADGDADGTAACDIGAFELGGLQCGIQATGEPADYPLLVGVNLRVTDDGTDLDCLRVTDIPPHHPHAAAVLKTGNYWQIAGLTGDRSTEATADYAVDLTLADDTADGASRACRYIGEGWDCAATSYIANTSVTRAGITELSDWAVGSGDCSEPVMPEPSISLTGAQKRDVLLTWDDDPANAGGYQVYRSVSPYFTPDADTLLATRPPGSTSYTDPGAGGTAGASYTYIVRGLSNCGVSSAYGQRLGVFNFGLVPGQ
jgi:CSLREA domain-containing protein